MSEKSLWMRLQEFCTCGLASRGELREGYKECEFCSMAREVEDLGKRLELSDRTITELNRAKEHFTERWLAERDALALRVEALTRYTIEHKAWCAHFPQNGIPCDCGLSALLAPPTTEGKTTDEP